MAPNGSCRIKLDHATVCGPELEPLRQAFGSAGLTADYGGAHANGVTHMALLGFEDGSYLELIAPRKAGLTEGSHWGGAMREGAGACAWALSVENIQAEVARLEAAGIGTRGPFAGSRKRPDGKVLEWEIASVGPGEPGALLPFLIEDHTPREWRVQPSASVRHSGLTGIAAVVLGVKDLDAATALFCRAYGWQAPAVEKSAEFGAKIAHFRDTPVILATPLVENSWLTTRTKKFGERPAAFLLGTRDWRGAEKRFGLAGQGKEKWFGRELAWFESEKLCGAKVGVIAE